jgi:hypothetical protein
MYKDSGFKNFTQFPKRILYPREYWVNINLTYIELCEAYVQRLEAFLGVDRTIVDSNQLWLQTSGHPDVNISDYCANVN